MREVSKSCTISAPCEAVWDFLCDYANIVRLANPESEAQLSSGTNGVPGAQYVVSVTWEGLRSKFPTMLQEAERPRYLLYTGALPGSSGALRFELECTDESATRLTATSVMWMGKGLGPLEPFGWAISSRLFEGLMERLERAEIHAS